MTSQPTTTQPLSSDAPIQHGEHDSFGRANLAKRVAAEAVTAPAGDGFVIALCGPWGSGKTSIANLVVDELAAIADAAVVRFNPWLFSGTHDLVGRFFGELAATLGQGDSRLKKVASKVARYAGGLADVASFVPVVGGPTAAVLTAAQPVLAAAGEGPTLEDRRRELAEALEEFDGRIVVFLDDLDRLTDDEIREIVRLVKLVGDLPRLTYVLAFDRARVEEALGAPEPDYERARERGRAYLEKIVQSRHDVPPLRLSKLVNFFGEQLENALLPFGERHLHATDWGNMLGLSLRHMLRTPRDAKRIANALPAALELVGEEVALVDLIGLEALRVLEPDVHGGLVGVSDILVDDRLTFGDEENQRQEDKRRIDELLSTARYPDETRKLLGQLFPSAYRALGGVGRGRRDERHESRDNRVAVPRVLRIYLHATLDDGAVTSPEIERFVTLLTEPAALRDALPEISDESLEDVLDRLLDHKDAFRTEYALGAAAAFLEIEPRLGDDESPIFSGRAPASWKLHWLVGHLLLAEEDEQGRTSLVEQLIDQAPTLSIRLRLINWFGTHPDRKQRDEDSEMLNVDSTERYLDDLRERVEGAAAKELVGEHMFRELIAGLLHPDEDKGREAIAAKAADDDFMLALLRSSYGYQRSQTMGEAAVRSIPRLGWRALTQLLGEDELRERIARLARAKDTSELDEDAAAALDLASKIAAGEIEPDPDWG